jgi:hypothetical protein
MASWKKAYPSNYLKKEDLEGDFTGTIVKVGPEEIGNDEDKETKLVIHFRESPAGCTVHAMVCNKTNCQLIEEVLGTDDIDLWIGRQITIFNNPKITFGGKKVGGISVRDTPQPANGDPFANVPVAAHSEFSVAELEKYSDPHRRLALVYNDIVRLDKAAAAQVPEKFFVVNGIKLGWSTVLKMSSEKAISWMENTLNPNLEGFLNSLGGPDLREDDIPF